MHPLKFEPFLRSMIWGGEKIAAFKGIESPLRSVGESWELSGVAGRESVVADGPCKGLTLTQVIERYGAELVGRSVYDRFGTEFPLLVKFIDAREDLSVQVHPDDRLAWKRHRQRGKTEMWYVVSETGGAHLRIGFDRPVTPERFAAAAADRSVGALLRDHRAAAGDVFFLPAGRIHTLGAGTFVAEIQQTSDLTYRIYDYDRRGPDGKPRELHTELAAEAVDYTVPDDYRTSYERIRNKDTVLVACPHFTVRYCDATFSLLCDYAALDSFVVLVFVGGWGELADSDGNRMAVRQGETVLVPASTRQVTLLPGREGLRFLSSYIDSEARPIPASAGACSG